MSVYSSFLLRCWLKRGEAPDSYAVEHVQSGEQFRAHTLAEVCGWIEDNNERLAATAPPQGAEPNGDEKAAEEEN